MAKAETQTYKLTRGNMHRWVGDKETGERVKVRAGAANGGDLIDLNEEDAVRFAKNITKAPNNVKRPVSTAPVILDGVQQRGQYTPEGGKEGNPLDAGPDQGEEATEAALADMTVGDAVKAINALDSVDAVKDAIKEEKAGKNRSTVLDAADTKIARLKGQ